MVNKRTLRKIASIKSHQAIEDWMQEQLEQVELAKQMRAKSAGIKSTGTKEGYSQSAPTGAGIIPRGSELDMNLQRMLGQTDEIAQGFMGQPAPPDDSHPMLENDTYYRRTSRRKYIGQAPNGAFISGEEYADISDGVILPEDETIEGDDVMGTDASTDADVAIIEESVKRILKASLVKQLRSRVDRVKRSRAMKYRG